ncbi:MAG: spermidine/putrescine ABC transporter substrate-binding protein [Actinomycetota bacterium]
MATQRTRARRASVLGIAGAVCAVLLAACGGGSSGGDASPSPSLDPSADLSKQSIVVSNWDAYMDPDVALKFTDTTKANITVAKHATNEEIVGKLTAGGDPGIDVAFVSGQYAQALNEAGLLEPIDPRLVPNMANLYPESKNLSFDPGSTFSVPYAWGTTGICYREDLMAAPPTSWNDLLNPAPEYEKKTLMLATQPWLNLPAAKALGFSANTTDEGELEQIKQQLLKTKPTLLGFDDVTFYSRLAAGEVVMAVAWDGWCNYSGDPNVKFVVPSEGADLWADTMVVLKSSKNKEAAMAYINFMIGDEMQSWMTNNILYKSPNKTVAEKAAAELGADFPNIAMTPADLAKGESLVDLGAASKIYQQIATEVQAS